MSSHHADPARSEALRRFSDLRFGILAANAPVLRALLGETVTVTGVEAIAYVPAGELRDLLRAVAPGRVLTTAAARPRADRGALTIMLEASTEPRRRRR